MLLLNGIRHKEVFLMKKFFSKIINYIKRTAWIQPLLIVVVIFLILFLLNPIANGISSIVSCIGDTNNMEEITFKEYTEKVENSAVKGTDNDPVEFVVVFTSDTCSHCKQMKPYINTYVKSKGSKVKLYNVDVTFNTKKDRYNDKTVTEERLQNLDERINQYYENNTSKNNVGAEPAGPDEQFQLIGTPMFIWYYNGLEVKVDVNPATINNNTEFREFISFPEVDDFADWDVEFDAKKILG